MSRELSRRVCKALTRFCKHSSIRVSGRWLTDAPRDCQRASSDARMNVGGRNGRNLSDPMIAKVLFRSRYDVSKLEGTFGVSWLRTGTEASLGSTSLSWLHVTFREFLSFPHSSVDSIITHPEKWIFPAGEHFKFSPGGPQWSLVGKNRSLIYLFRASLITSIIIPCLRCDYIIIYPF